MNVTVNCDNWKVVVCEVIEKKWSNFTVAKSDMVERACEHFTNLKHVEDWYDMYRWTQQERIISV